MSKPTSGVPSKIALGGDSRESATGTASRKTSGTASRKTKLNPNAKSFAPASPTKKSTGKKSLNPDANAFVPGARRSGKNEREKDFDTCAEEQLAERKKYNLVETTYNDRIRQQLQVYGLGKLIQNLGLFKNNGFLTYAGMAQIAEVLCRWPRPRELAAVALHKDFRDLVTLTEHSGRKHLVYFRSVVSFRREEGYPMSKLIGPKGQNLVALTEGKDLLYAWCSLGKLFLYASDRAQLLEAVKEFKGWEGVVAKSVTSKTSTKTFTTSMKDFNQMDRE